jgi:hypothetical protein
MIKVNTIYHRGVWHSKSGTKGQSRFLSSQRPNPGPHDKKESQTSIKGGAGRGQGTGKERGSTWQGAETARHPDAISTPLVEEHMPMNGYNARAVEAAMSTPSEARPTIYEPAGRPPSGARSGSAPWGSKRVFCNP